MNLLKVISIQSQNADETCRQITEYLGEQLGMATEFVADLSWQERGQLLDTEQAQIGWICGLPYVRKLADRPGSIELIAAPVMSHPRYRGEPLYFSDVIVRQDRPYKSFADLRGASWAYNEPHSQSGYNITRYHLAQIGESAGYFSRAVESGAHLRSIEMVLNGAVEASAIDSTVLELAFEEQPLLRKELRVIENLGPSPIPPWVVSTTVDQPLRQAIREVFWHMHKSSTGRDILAAGQLMKMVPVNDGDYDIVRKMAAVAQQVNW